MLLSGLKKTYPLKDGKMSLAGLRKTPIIQPSVLDLDFGGTKTTTPMFRFARPEPTKPEPIKAADIIVGKELSPKAEQLKIEAEKAEKETKKGLLRRFVPALGEVAKDISQSIARNIASAGATIAKVIKPEAEFKFDDLSLFGQELSSRFFGLKEGEEIKSVEQRIAEAEPKIKEWGEQRGGTLGEIAKGNPEALAFVGIMGSVGLDLSFFGGMEKNVLKAMVKTKSAGEAVKLLLKMGVADDLARTFADDVVKAGTTKEAKALFSSIANLQKTTRVAPKVAPTIVPEARKGVAPAFKAEKGAIPQPLAQEARKIAARGGTAEEFVEGLKKEVSLKTDKNKLLDVRATEQSLPPVRRGFERFYRGESPTVKHAEVWDERKMSVPPGAKAGDSFWITPDLKYAKYYKDTYGTDAKVFYIDLPKGLAKADIRFEGEFFVNKSQFTDFYYQAVKGVEVIPEPKTIIQKLTDAIKGAKPVRKEQEKLYTIERGKRVAKVAAVGEKVKGEAGYYAQLGQLKGELPKARFEAVKKLFSQNEVDSLFDMVEAARLTPLEKVSAKKGLLNLFEGRVPTQSELMLFKEIFPKELTDAILSQRTLSQKIFGMIGQVINVPRAVMASVDLSAPFRQGLFLIGRPKRFASAFGDMFKYAFSEKSYVGLMENIKTRSNYLKMRKAKVAFTELGADLTTREEAIMSNLPERIPILGRLFRGSNRAYTGFLNKLRADVFDDILKKTGELSDNELESIGRYVNAATGRGDIGQLQRASVMLNTLFFSPRLIASRINLLNPYFYATLTPTVRKEALKDLAKVSAITGTVLALAKMGGAEEVSGDPRNADFGKIKIGNTRYDPLGGFQQYIRLMSQLISGEIISSTTGRTITLGEGYKPLTRKDIALRFFEYKTSPIASFVIGLAQGTTAMGEDFDIPTEIINRFIPMVIQDMYELSQESGAEELWAALPAVFGVGLQTYGKQELVFGESRIGEETAQIRPVPEMAEKIREIVIGQLPLGTSKGFSVEAYFDQLSNLPKEQAADIYDKINEVNPELAKKLRDVVKERELDITVEDKDLKAKGVASGDRALAVKKELDKLETKEEKATLWDDYTKKGIITKKVANQLKTLLNQ